MKHNYLTINKLHKNLSKIKEKEQEMIAIQHNRKVGKEVECYPYVSRKRVFVMCACKIGLYGFVMSGRDNKNKKRL